MIKHFSKRQRKNEVGISYFQHLTKEQKCIKCNSFKIIHYDAIAKLSIIKINKINRPPYSSITIKMFHTFIHICLHVLIGTLHYAPNNSVIAGLNEGIAIGNVIEDQRFRKRRVVLIITSILELNKKNKHRSHEACH